MGIADQPASEPTQGATSRRAMLLATFTAAITLSAALLFMVQPMFTKMVLPHFGGAEGDGGSKRREQHGAPGRCALRRLARWLLGDPHALALSRCAGARNSGCVDRRPWLSGAAVYARRDYSLRCTHGTQAVLNHGDWR